jgi:hypothetical protein
VTTSTARVTVQFDISNLDDDYKDLGYDSYADMVRWLIDEEGLMGIVDFESQKIIKIEKL